MHHIQSHIVRLVLQYIAPPSQLSQPLPRHLISTALFQRHHYLQITPTNPVEYLCWPAPHNSRAIQLLDKCTDLSDEDQSDGYSVRYTSDPDDAYAHVQISEKEEGLRMLFQWDDVEGWRYHDLQLMPFPELSFLTPEESLSLIPPVGVAFDRAQLIESVAEANSNTDVDDDPYWDSYGASADNVSPLPSHRGAKEPLTFEGEDAYWAQYASVQGSGDSTVPSPLPRNGKLPISSNFSSQEEPIIIPASTIHSKLTSSKLAPPSPNTLTHLLNIISPRKDLYSPRSDEPRSAVTPNTLSTHVTTDDSDLPTPVSADGDQLAHVVSPVHVKLNGVPFEMRHPHTALVAVEEDRALTDSIKGLYYLWKAGSRKDVSGKGSEAFLRIVRAAIPQE
ncbi:hypothetical protein F5I97DRAFT_1813788 [Phlebopus sp. FC_14]|nr:hypothetical protein F5I97DRAFT_1813788 [Phlebopus sp. FC_14]